MRLRMLLVLCAALALTWGVATSAASDRVTRGDAEAVLQAFGNGGWAVLMHGGVVHGAPSQGFSPPVAIKPFSGSFYDGAHYCALDWHTIMISVVDAGPRQAFAASIAGIAISFTLDGAPLPVTQTAIKRYLNPAQLGFTDAYYSSWGRVIAPTDLAFGAHTLGVEVSDSGGPLLIDGITFYVDPAGTGACL
jgi:hypothetical protein